MRLLTLLAVATLAAGVFHYRARRLARAGRDRQAVSDAMLEESDEPVGDLGPMQSGTATGI